MPHIVDLAIGLSVVPERSPGCDHGADRGLPTTTQILYSDRAKARRSSVFNPISLASGGGSGDGSGDDSDLFHYRAKFTLELSMLSTSGGLPSILFV